MLRDIYRKRNQMGIYRVVLAPPSGPTNEVEYEIGGFERIYLYARCSLITNGGGICQTDWTNPGVGGYPGLAEFWSPVDENPA